MEVKDSPGFVEPWHIVATSKSRPPRVVGAWGYISSRPFARLGTVGDQSFPFTSYWRWRRHRTVSDTNQNSVFHSSNPHPAPHLPRRLFSPPLFFSSSFPSSFPLLLSPPLSKYVNHPNRKSAIFSFSSLITVLLLLICTCTFLRALRPNIFDNADMQTRPTDPLNPNSPVISKRTGVPGMCWKFSRVGERLSPYVSAACFGLIIHLLFLK